MRGTLAAAVAAILIVAACSGNGNSTDAASAKNCEQLIERAARVAKQVVADLAGKSAADVAADATDPNEPFAALEEPFAPFQARADSLGCDRGELRRLACSAYQGIESNGPAAEEFLARVDDICR
ncbi:MAG TPA: hypothetical protein VGQ20_12370 [Acidimicrobiales bacterium]|nr:hypothetical protein [Acidimicrobiales bacterium]